MDGGRFWVAPRLALRLHVYFRGLVCLN